MTRPDTEKSAFERRLVEAFCEWWEENYLGSKWSYDRAMGQLARIAADEIEKANSDWEVYLAKVQAAWVDLAAAQRMDAARKVRDQFIAKRGYRDSDYYSDDWLARILGDVPPPPIGADVGEGVLPIPQPAGGGLANPPRLTGTPEPPRPESSPFVINEAWAAYEKSIAEERCKMARAEAFEECKVAVQRRLAMYQARPTYPGDMQTIIAVKELECLLAAIRAAARKVNK